MKRIDSLVEAARAGTVLGRYLGSLTGSDVGVNLWAKEDWYQDLQKYTSISGLTNQICSYWPDKDPDGDGQKSVLMDDNGAITATVKGEKIPFYLNETNEENDLKQEVLYKMIFSINPTQEMLKPQYRENKNDEYPGSAPIKYLEFSIVVKENLNDAGKRLDFVLNDSSKGEVFRIKVDRGREFGHLGQNMDLRRSDDKAWDKKNQKWIEAEGFWNKDINYICLDFKKAKSNFDGVTEKVLNSKSQICDKFKKYDEPDPTLDVGYGFGDALTPIVDLDDFENSDSSSGDSSSSEEGSSSTGGEELYD